MKKIIIGLFLVICLFMSTGCSEKETTTVKKDKNEHICVKKGIEDSSSTSGTSWKKDITFTAKLNDDGKLTYYSTKYEYNYNSKEDCDYWCDIKVKWNDEINAKNYTGGHRETKCSCDNKKLTEEYVYDDIENLASILRSDISQLNSDNTFNLEKWLEVRNKNGYKCD